MKSGVFRLKIFFWSLICAFFFVFLLVSPNIVSSAVQNSLLLCGEIIIPSLFPFAVLSLFLYNTGICNYAGKLLTPLTRKIFRLSDDAAAVFLMSFIGGYPIGSKLINELCAAGKISAKKAGTMLCYCINAGPAFIVVAVGCGMLKNKCLGYILLAAHIISSLVLAFIMARFDKEPPSEIRCLHSKICISDAFVKSTSDACKTMFGICGWVVLFGAVVSIFKAIGISEYIYGFFEVTIGCRIMSDEKRIFLIAFFLGFSGMSVIFQILSISTAFKPSFLKITVFRLLHGGFSAVVTFLILNLYPKAIETVTNGTPVIFANNSFTAPITLAFLLLAATFLFFIKSDNNDWKLE